jgi:hypothetical protein
MPPHPSLRISTPKTLLCARCGCEGEFKNEDTGEAFVVTGSSYGELGENFLTSDRVCFCSTCTEGCETSWARKMRNYIVEAIGWRARF